MLRGGPSAASRARLLRLARTGALVGVIVLALVFVVVPQFAGVGTALRSIEQVTPWVLATVVALEALSLLSYTVMTRSILPDAGRPSFGVLLRIDLAGYGLSHVIPGGGAAAAGARYQLWTRQGVARRDAATATAIETGVSFSALVILFAVGAVVGLPQSGTPPALVVGGIAGLAILGALASGAVLLIVRPDWVVGAVRGLATRVGWVDPVAAESLARTLAEQVRALAGDRGLLVRASAAGMANWALDAAALWLALHTFGFSPNLWQMLAAYGLVNILALLPVTPGGLGIVEGILVPTLVGIGAQNEQALLGVLTWRLVQFWATIPIGLACYLSLPRRASVPRPKPSLLPRAHR